MQVITVYALFSIKIHYVAVGILLDKFTDLYFQKLVVYYQKIVVDPQGVAVQTHHVHTYSYTDHEEVDDTSTHQPTREVIEVYLYFKVLVIT